MAEQTKNEQRITGYAEALLSVATNEPNAAEVADELFRLARVIEGSDELSDALTDQNLPAARRQQIVEDLLAGKASTVTIALVSMVVGVGHARDLPAIIDRFVELIARRGDRSVAEVRSAIELTDDQLARLTDALSRAVGGAVEVKVIIDPTVLGGVITQIGDTVIDGSVRHRLSQLRETMRVSN
ncbi:MAG: ATP synthase F1 subunit delta [Actinomycetes bacterium]